MSYTVYVNTGKKRVEIWDIARNDLPATCLLLMNTFEGITKAMDQAAGAAKNNNLETIRLFDRPESDDMPTIVCDYSTFRRLTIDECVDRCECKREGEKLP